MPLLSKLSNSYLIVSFLFIFACESGNTEDESLLDPEIPESIIGGEPTGGASQWRGVVALVSGGGLCTGTLIHPRLVLTAGHCVKLHNHQGNYDYTLNPSAVRIMAGASTDQGTLLSRAEKIRVHPTWTGNVTTDSIDLALVYLSKSTSNINTFQLSDFPNPTPQQEATIVGYGIGPKGESGIQRIGQTTIQTVTNQFITIGGESTICSGDSGGPVFVREEDKWKVVGVNSFGAEETCNPQFEMYTVNVHISCHWLNTAMKELVGINLGLTHCTQCQTATPKTWGGPCGPNLPECPASTVCYKPADFSQNGYGYCAAPCCSLGSADTRSCFDVSNGDERCSFITKSGQQYCAVHCETSSDCNEGMVCRNRPFESEKICIADGSTTAMDSDIKEDVDTDAPVASDGEENTDGDVDGPGRAASDSGSCRTLGFWRTEQNQKKRSARQFFALMRKLF